MKGTIRVRENRDGSKSYVCQVKLGRDPGTGKARVLTGTAKSERAAHRLLHELIAKAEDGSQHASDATVATVIEQWLATGGPAGEATRQVYAGYIRLHVLPALGDVPLRKLGVGPVPVGAAGRAVWCHQASRLEHHLDLGIRNDATWHQLVDDLSVTPTLARIAERHVGIPSHHQLRPGDWAPITEHASAIRAGSIEYARPPHRGLELELGL